MGFWDREVRDTFDRLFDLNRDGMLDPAEIWNLMIWSLWMGMNAGKH